MRQGSKAGFLRCTSRVSMCNATQGNQRRLGYLRGTAPGLAPGAAFAETQRQPVSHKRLAPGKKSTSQITIQSIFITNSPGAKRSLELGPWKLKCFLVT